MDVKGFKIALAIAKDAREGDSNDEELAAVWEALDIATKLLGTSVEPNHAKHIDVATEALMPFCRKTAWGTFAMNSEPPMRMAYEVVQALVAAGLLK